MILDQFGCLREAELVALLKLAVVFINLLNGVVRQVDEWVVEVTLLQSKRVRRCPDVAFFEDEGSHVVRDQDPKSDVELAIVY